MRAFIVHCHPNPPSRTAAVRNIMLDRPGRAGARIRVHRLCAKAFGPIQVGEEFAGFPSAGNPACRPPLPRPRTVQYTDPRSLDPVQWTASNAEGLARPGAVARGRNDPIWSAAYHAHRHFHHLQCILASHALHRRAGAPYAPSRCRITAGAAYSEVFMVHCPTDSAISDSPEKHLARVAVRTVGLVPGAAPAGDFRTDCA